MKENRRVLVTGGAGYVGSVLTEKALKVGHDVKVIDTFWFGAGALKRVQHHPRLRTILGDLRNGAAVENAMKGVDAVIHLASISNDPSSELDHSLTQSINFDILQPLIDSAKRNGVKRFINASTSSVYGIKETPNVTEDLLLEPLTIYSRTKADGEKVIRDASSDSFTTVSLRSATVCGYSPRMRFDLVANIFVQHAFMNRKIKVFGGTNKRPSIHIDDITDYYTQLLSVPSDMINGEVFNAGGENLTVLELANLVRDAFAGDIQIETVPTDDHRSYHINSNKIKNALGFVPKRTIRDAVLDVKLALEAGWIGDFNDDVYYNVKRMKRLLEEGKCKSST